MSGCTTVTHQHITHERIQEHVEERGDHQKPDGPYRLIPRPCCAAGHSGSRHNGQAECRREVFLPPQIRTAADPTASETAGLIIRRPLCSTPATPVTANGCIRRFRCGDFATAAGRTLKDNVTAHGLQSSKNDGGSAFRKEQHSGKSGKIGKITGCTSERQAKVSFQQRGRHFTHKDKDQNGKQHTSGRLSIAVLQNAANEDRGQQRSQHPSQNSQTQP